MKTNKPVAFIGLCILGAFIAISCSNPFAVVDEQSVTGVPAAGGVLTVAIGDAGASASRTIVPVASDLPAIASYDLTLTCAGQTTKTATFTAPTLTGSFSFLVPGTWTVTVIGKTVGGAIVATGSSDVTVTASASAAVTVTLKYIIASATDPGSMALTLTFPKSVGIDSVEASIDGIAVTPAPVVSSDGDTNNKTVCSATGLTVASPLVRISLKKSGVVLLTWVERVWVYKNITTTNSPALDAASFNSAPPAPGSLTSASLQPDGKVTLSWPNVGTAESYRLERSEDGGTVYTDVFAEIPAGTLTHTDTLPYIAKTYKYRLSATNTFGTSASTINTADVEISPTFIVAHDEAALEVVFQGTETLSTILTNLTLAATGSAGTTIAWTSTNTAVAINGTVTRPEFTEFATGDVTGTLTAIIMNNGVSVIKEFPVTVIRQPGVSFDANTGSGSTAAVAIATGSSANLTMNAFTKTGYSFAGWAETPAGAVIISDGASYSMTSTVPVILYAKWTVNSYSIGYMLNGGSLTGPPTSYTIESATITPAAPTRTGYTFSGWSPASIPAGSTGNKVFTAGWTPITYTISYTLNGGTHTSTPASYTIESAVINPAAPTRTGYTFTGWSPASIPAGSTGNKIFIAGWTPTSYSISYELNDGTHTSTPASYTIQSATITPASPTRTGYTFNGWSPASIPAGSTGDKTFAAIWTVAAPVEDTKFNNKMIFDCQQRPNNPSIGYYTAGTLKAAYDASVLLNYIPELTVGNASYVSGAYIALKITTAGDGNTISVAALVLKRSDNTEFRTVSSNGNLGYLGSAGFIYVSYNGFGYFFAREEHTLGTSFTYAYTTNPITLKSQLGSW